MSVTLALSPLAFLISGNHLVMKNYLFPLLIVKHYLISYSWRHDLSPKSELTGDDLQILIDLIEEDLMNRKSSYFSKCFAAAYSFAFPISLKKFQNPANEISFIRRIKNKSMTAIWNNPQSCFWNILIHLPGAGNRNDTIIVPMND